MLNIENLSVAYGGLNALSGVSLAVTEGQFIAIVGPNGAGKTTLFKAISGTVTPVSGGIVYEGRDLLGVPPWQRAQLGIAHVPEGRQVFSALTVLENLEMGAYPQNGRQEWARNIERIYALFPVLAERRHQLAGTLSGGEQQMLALGRAMMAKPRLLLLDEPSLGLAPLVVREIFATLRDLNERGTTILVVEQNAVLALGAAKHAYVLETGRVALGGTAEELRRDDSVRRSYLGY